MTKRSIIKLFFNAVILDLFPKKKLGLIFKNKLIDEISKKSGYIIDFKRFIWSFSGKITIKDLVISDPLIFSFRLSTVEFWLDRKLLIKKNIYIKRLAIDELLIEDNRKVKKSNNNNNGRGNIKFTTNHKRVFYYLKLLFKITDILGKFTPGSLLINNTLLKCSIQGKGYQFVILNLTLTNTKFKAYLKFEGKYSPLTGELFAEKHLLQFKISPSKDLDLIKLLNIQDKISALNVDYFTLSINSKTENTFSLDLTNKGLVGMCRFISANKFSFDIFQISVRLLELDDGFDILQSSYIQFNCLKVNFGFRLDIEKNMSLSLSFNNMTLERLLKSVNFFENQPLYNLNIIGVINLVSFVFKSNLNEISSFSSNIVLDDHVEKTHPPKWLDFGEISNAIKSGTFTTRPISGDDYMSLEGLPTILIKCVLMAEDENFYHHKGIDTGGIGHALIANLLEKRFVRGGSTITMQVIRNLLLDYDKNIFRKLEEVFLTYLIEIVYDTPKDLILELYLNIIEFGLNIYGVKAACNFYFDKSPQDLNLLECIVLTYIIPRPKYFLEALEMDSPRLRKNLYLHISSILAQLSYNQVIAQSEADMKAYTINIRGILVNLP